MNDSLAGMGNAPTAPIATGGPVPIDTRIPEQFHRVAANIRRVILGKDEVVARLLWAVAAQGHVLFRDVPGVGKTMLAKAFAASVDCTFKRIQFTPDLLPMDVSGSNVFDMRNKTFQFQPGPVFTNVLLADEINRAPPKTQSALLEVMEERQVTVEGTTHALAAPFIAIATMNPLEDEGTYALPAAQLDRFMMMLSVGYPAEEAEAKMLEVHLGQTPALASLEPVITKNDVLGWQAAVPRIYVSPEMRRYLVSVLRAIRSDDRNLRSVSPRSTIQLARACQARALFSGRPFVSVEDVKTLAPDVLGHRVMTSDSGVGRELVAQCVERVPAPA
ncbi:MoxR-like ATPase [Labilithrix luteola]|uniref:MoxR-like ATPase n=1 Tax=Labilithrix luteola TaxID=1391654 RepID=A0A0K1QFX2_9BACT|nr:MoxR family ATPase [Labilithrix luteola]AKV04623.1 MoxR-like ATPase [Labilithrix luteola]